MKYTYKNDIDRFVQLATRVWGVEEGTNDKETITLAGIAKLEEFWKSLGLPIRLSDADIDNSKFEEMAQKYSHQDTQTTGAFVKLTAKDIVKIYELAQ